MRIDLRLPAPLLLLVAASCGGTNSSGSSGTTSSASGVVAATGSASGSITVMSGSATGTSSAGSASGTTGSSAGVGSGTVSATSGATSGAGASGTPGTSGGAVAGSSTGAATGSGATSPPSGTSASGASSQGGAPDASTPFDASFPPSVDSGAATPIGDPTLPRKLYIENHCTYTIWSWAQPPSTFPNSVPLKTDAGQAYVVGWPDKWQGRIWGRTKCNAQGQQCAQGSGPDTLAEFALTAGMASDWYDISLVDGFSIPTAILQVSQPFTLSGNWVPGAFNASGTFVVGSKLGSDGLCGSPVCAVDLLANCPASQVKKGPDGTIAACHNGDNGPGQLAGYFKAGCPTSYSWPFDDPWSLFRCADYRQNNGVGSKDYKIVYCPEQGPTPGFPPYPITQ